MQVQSAGVGMRISVISAALVASLVGYGSTSALVLAAARAVTATEAQTASWVLASCLAKGLGSAGLSFLPGFPWFWHGRHLGQP